MGTIQARQERKQHEPSSSTQAGFQLLQITFTEGLLYWKQPCQVYVLHVSTFAFYKFTLDIAPKIPPQTLSSTHQTCFIGFFVRSQPQKHRDTTTVLPWTSNIDEAPRNRKTINLDICECTPILRQRDIDTSKDLPRKNVPGKPLDARFWENQ